MLLVKNLPANAGDVRDMGGTPGSESPLYKELSFTFLIKCHSSDGKENACNAGEPGSIPRPEDLLEKGMAYPLWYPCLENPMDRGTWWATVHGVTYSWTRLSD